ncbi:MAG: calcium-binding protein [Pseudomonadota bacterium]
MVFGIALLSLFGIALVVEIVDDDDDSSSSSEPDGIEITGTEDADVIAGTAGADVLAGGDGEDTITGGDASDTIEGGNGEDLIEGNAGDDLLQGQADADVIIGGAGDDVIASGQGNDFAQGRGGNDSLAGSLGADWLDGNDGNDTVSAGFGDDSLLGGAGADLLDGGAGNDLMTGGVLANVDLSTSDLVGLRDGTLTFDQAAGLEDIDDNVLDVSDDDDDARDTLIGGDGDDSILLGSGDTATGGEGFDAFGILADALEGTQGLGTITDFVPGEDFIFVFDDLDLPAEPSISVLTSGSDAIVALNGQPVTTVTGAAGSLSIDDIGFFTGLSISFVDPVS